MLFMIAAFLKSGAERKLIKYSAEFSEHVGPNASNVVFAGDLRDETGRQVGYLAIVKGDTIDDAKRWLHDGPYYQANLYKRIEVFEYRHEIGRFA